MMTYLRDVDVANCRVRIEPISNQLPVSEAVPRLLSEFCRWLEREGQKTQEDVMLLAARAKHRFVCIHPFVDGNGRVSRALVNLVLMWFHQPERGLYLPEAKRDTYYKALKQADAGNMYPLRDFIEFNMPIAECGNLSRHTRQTN